MSIEILDVPKDKMEVSETKEGNTNETKNKTPEAEAKRPRGRAKGTKYPQTKYVDVDRDKDVLAKIDQLSNQLNELKTTSNRVGNSSPKHVERTPIPEPGAEPRSERNYVQQRMDRLQARKQNYSNLFNSIHK